VPSQCKIYPLPESSEQGGKIKKLRNSRAKMQKSVELHHGNGQTPEANPKKVLVKRANREPDARITAVGLRGGNIRVKKGGTKSGHHAYYWASQTKRGIPMSVKGM